MKPQIGSFRKIINDKSLARLIKESKNKITQLMIGMKGGHNHGFSRD